MDIWKALHESFVQSGDNGELLRQEKLQQIRRSSFSLLVTYQSAFKLICDEFDAIDMPLPDQRKVFQRLNGLGPDYAMFTTTMIFNPCPYCKMGTKLSSSELRLCRKNQGSGWF